MIQTLIGRIPVTTADMVDSKTSLRFKNRSDFKTPEALIIHEQQIISDDMLLDACCQEYNMVLDTPKSYYVPKEILNEFEQYQCVVINYDAHDRRVTLGIMPENRDQIILSDTYTIKRVMIPIYYYVELRTAQYGTPDFLAELPIPDKWEFIVDEAIKLQASDITLTTTSHGAEVYYNVRKTKVHSKRQLKTHDVNEICKLLASSGGATMGDMSSKPRFFAIDLNKHYRGRVVINKTYYGLLCTIRVLSNALLDKTLEDLHIKPNTIEFIRETVLSPEKGLRLFIGETMSGKNTTILSALLELVKQDKYKIVSLEQPVEILVDGIEQINAETDEEFEQNADSLLRQNPDIVYFTEITARTGTAIMQQSNTSKAVFSTIHANSIAEVLFRLQDITHMPIDRILLTLHSCVYQELVRDDRTDTVTPYNRCVYFDEDLKMNLYGKSTAEIIGVLRAKENRW